MKNFALKLRIQQEAGKTTKHIYMSLFLRNFFFTLLQPGIVVLLIPYLLLGETYFLPSIWKFMHYTGSLIFMAGFIIMLLCIIRFGTHGKGTLSPVDRTKILVTSGLYGISRNPMYIGVLLMLLGEALFVGKVMLWIYILIVFITFNVFILVIEEPRLKRDFGIEYQDYCKQVRRWI